MISPGAKRLSSLTGSEVIVVDNGGATIVTATAQQVADLASLSSNNLQITALTTVGAGTITAAGIVGGITARGGAQSATGFTDTTATAALIIAALPSGAPVGTTFLYRYENNTDGDATLAGGTDVTLSGNTVVSKNTWAEYLMNVTAATTVSMTFVGAGEQFVLPNQKVTSTAMATVTQAVGGLTGAQVCTQIMTGTAGPGNINLPTAAQIIAALPQVPTGYTFQFNLRNIHSTTAVGTLVTNTGITLTGVATVAQNATAMFAVSVDSQTALTFTRIGP